MDPQAVDLRTSNLAQPGAAAKRPNNELLRRRHGRDHGVHVSFQQFVDRDVVWHELAADRQMWGHPCY